MFRRVLLAAVLAGLAAGLLMAAVQHWRVTPLIIAAEAFEQAPASADAPALPGAGDDHDHETGGWAPADGWQRTAATAAADVGAGIGFAVLLAGISLLLNAPITTGNGLIWGLAGFIAFALAPAAGLPPELPGMPAGDLAARQLWWWFAAIGTGAGLGFILLKRSAPWIALGLALIAAPQIIGAPAPVVHDSAVPATLATAFAANALAASAIFWLALGAALGWLMPRTQSQ